jgi:hypothetical protein
VWVGFAVVLVVPSPKFHDRLVILPVEVSVKLTDTGAIPDVGVAEKLATGGAVVTLVTVMNFNLVFFTLPLGPVAVRLTSYVPAVG